MAFFVLKKDVYFVFSNNFQTSKKITKIMRKTGIFIAIPIFMTFSSSLFGIFGLECLFSRFKSAPKIFVYQPLVPYRWRDRDPLMPCNCPIQNQSLDLDSSAKPLKITCQEHLKSLKIYRKNVKHRGAIAREFYWERSFKHRPEEMPIFEWLKFWFRKRLRIY